MIWTMLYMFVFAGALLTISGPVLLGALFYFIYKEEKEWFKNMKDELNNG